MRFSSIVKGEPSVVFGNHIKLDRSQVHVFDVQLRRKDLNPQQKISEKTIGFQCSLVGLTSMKLQSGMAVRLLGGKFF